MGSLSDQYEAQQKLVAQGQRPWVLTRRRLAVAGGVALAVIALSLIVPRLIPKSDQQRYLDDWSLIAEAASAASGRYCGIMWRYKAATGFGNSPRECAKVGVYPVFALGKEPEVTDLGGSSRVDKSLALKEEDAGNTEITILVGKGTNLVGGMEHGGTPKWEDVDGDGKRVHGDEKLFYHNASPVPTIDHWNTTTVTRAGIVSVVDSRDWFIDIDMLVENRVLKRVPDSASPDNSVHGKGSYSWYMDEGGKVKSMLYHNPRPEADGFQAVYP